MRTPRTLPVSILVVLALGATASKALAFGGTARELEHQGNFVVRNNVVFDYEQPLNNQTFASFVLGPALDYFVIDNLSLGGAVQVGFNSTATNPTFFLLAPDIGVELALTDTFSFWPQAALTMRFPNPGSATVTLDLSVPFLVHPAEHFFFGIGPGFSQDLTAHPTTAIFGSFTVGGYFDH
jgi:hypothetical protein